MTEPKLHHYVPRFYLAQFLDANGKLWAYDKLTDRVFRTTPSKIAAEKQFYRLPDFVVAGNDPLSIEKALSKLESQASSIIGRVISELSLLAALERVAISDDERIVLSEFIATQYFRTLELRDLMLYLLEDSGLVEDDLNEEEKKAIHFTMLSDFGFLERFAESIHKAIWIFAKNETGIPFITSDHPVCVKDGNNLLWLKGVGPLDSGSYIVFPVSPTLILYCKEFSFWSKLQDLDLCLSPVALDAGMVQHENCGQAFMASRFLISCSSDFQEVRDFIPSIGTHLYAPEGLADSDEVKRTAVYNSKRRSNAKSRKLPRNK
jgi:Protein of unknown function (DUF4238)